MQEQEHMKRCLYRLWYPKRRQDTEKAPHKTYNQRFAELCGETLDEYHARLKHEATMNFYMKAGR